MRRSLAVFFALTAAACGGSTTTVPASGAPQEVPASPAATAPATGAAGGQSVAADRSTVTGVVAETMNSGGYTYARLTGPDGDTWVATAEMPIDKGARMTASVSVAMQNFHSRTLNRDFPAIYFVQQVTLNGVAVASNEDAAAAAGVATGKASPGADLPAMANSHDADAMPAAEAPKLIAKVDPAPGGLTVLQVWQKRADLSGKPVTVRGQVVKANYEIMGSHWYHIQDGTGVPDAGTHDLTVTSRDRVAVGDIVTISGPITLGKDFGAGYAYDVMVEGATIRK
jgi:hypothetical protein